MDARRLHKLLTTLEEDGSCRLTDEHGEQVLVNISNETVVRALHIQEGNYDTSAMKLSLKEKLTVFKADKPKEGVYLELRDDRVKLAL